MKNVTHVTVTNCFWPLCQGTFKVTLLKKYGDLATAWFQCIDVGKDGHVQESLPGAKVSKEDNTWDPNIL